MGIAKCPIPRGSQQSSNNRSSALYIAKTGQRYPPRPGIPKLKINYFPLEFSGITIDYGTIILANLVLVKVA
jgi:hypothetical protein